MNAQSGITGATHWSIPTTRRYCECGSGLSGSSESGVTTVVGVAGVEASLQSIKSNSLSIWVKYAWSSSISLPSLVLWRTRPMNRTLAPSSFKWPVYLMRKTRNNFLKYFLNVKHFSEHHQVIYIWQNDDKWHHAHIDMSIWFESSESQLLHFFRKESLPFSWGSSKSIDCWFTPPHQFLCSGSILLEARRRLGRCRG